MPASRVELCTDVLVIGAGAAGIRAALEAGRNGAEVVVAAKGKLGHQGSTFCPYAPTWGYQASGESPDPDDSPEEHLGEIAEASWGVADLSLADILVHEAADRLADLRRFGLDVDRVGGAPIQDVGCFSRRPRCYMVTGKDRIRSRFLSMLDDSGARVMAQTTITDLLVDSGECVGAVGYACGQTVIIWAKAVILATGGGANLFAYNFNTSDLVGDGQAMALRAGASLMNMEFYQIGFGISHPVKQVLFEGRLLHYGPKLLNGLGQPFVEKYLPPHLSLEECLKARANHMPFSIRDDSMYLDVATHCEILAERGTSHNSVVADFRRLTRETLCETPIGARCYEGILEKGLDITETPIEITLHVHALNGGVRIDSRAQTDVPGLFAAGEVAAGPHGADRLGGNMMPTTQVFGARAGRFAAERAASIKASRGDLRPHRELLELLDEWAAASGASTSGDSPLSHAKRLVGMSMWRNAVVARTEQGLTDAERVLGDVRGALERAVPGDDGDARTFFDLRSMTMLGQAILAACKLRKESRGSHHRLDFPLTSDDLCRPIRVSLRGGEISAEIARW